MGELYGRALPKLQQRKLLFGVLYVVFVMYMCIPSFDIPLIEYSRFRVSSVMEERALEHFMLYYPKQSWVSLDDVSPNLLRSVVSMEDGKFFMHKGIDWEELEHSMKVNKRRKRIARGGSTITMQLAKNLFLRTDKNMFRKAKELMIALRMEKEVSKKAMLEHYINAVEWGDGIFGIREASLEYFNKEPDALTLNECARLAAVIPSPLEHKPTDNSPYVLHRASLIRGRYNDVTIP
ncbi:MAG: monofunctional biosynthetic peptidoglycan transglycosylase [Ignavibacteria bacterium]|nr:monofunctional biosynthetic peptidoglycan transglycosylase [Ignavibacteria bacterium]MCU7502818.1 monofunctional biosynthetic peptidoglycan transglycosylase [Ignavibacteria bacterium]MCU7517902.1 monofunctional biosynthetic peptidoglycan transglycosylase [Ignavibacteria bacterium]